MRGERIMKKTKKIISLLLSVLMIITSIPLMAVNSFAADEITSGKYEYVVLDDGTAEITDYFGSATKLTIPSEIDGYKVTSIGDSAFEHCDSFTSITIPDSVTSIGERVFSYCTSLTSITIPDSITSISNNAFSSCKSLASITIPDGVTSIGKLAFDGCTSLTSITVPNSVTSIGYSAFENCTSLTSITIPNSVTSIDYDAFFGCKSLASITIPDSVTSISNNAFSSCISLTSITIPDSVTNIGYGAFSDTAYYNDKLNWKNGILYIGNHLIEAKDDISGSVEIKQGTKIIAESAFFGCTSLTSITIPDSVTSIGGGAFSGCTSLTSITIPDSVTSIDNSAFSRCSSLTSITIPKSVTSIGVNTFYGCTALTEINVGSENANYSSENGVLFNKEKTTLKCYPAGKTETEYTIPDSVTSIDYGAFSSCKSLASITIPDSITSIGNNAFSNCESLASITVPDNVTRICYGAFSDTAYYNDKLNWENGILYIGNHLIEAKDDISGSVSIKQGTKLIADSAFEDCELIESVMIPNSVTEIGRSAFYMCTSLKNILIPDSVKTISPEMFTWCVSLEKIGIPNSVTSIGWNAFGDCTALKHIIVPDSVTNIDDYAFGYTGVDLEHWTGGGFSILTKITDFTVYGKFGSEAEKYANDNGFVFLELEQSDRLVVSKHPSKTTYFVGDTLDITGLELIATYNNGDTEKVTSGYTVSGFDSETAGIKTITVTYKEKGTTFEVEVVELSITLSNNSLSFDSIGRTKALTATTAPSGQKITWTSSNTSVATVSDDGVVTAKGDGNATITAKFTYNGIAYSTTCNVTVKVPVVLSSVSVSKMPAKATYFVGDTLDITGLELIATYSNGDTEIVTNGYTVSGFDSSTAGTKTVTVDYKGKTATFTVEVFRPTVSFPDVASGEWYYNAIAFNVEKGYFHGYGNGYFGPGDNIQRQDFVVLLSRIAGADLSAYEGQNGGFADVPNNDYYSAAVAWARDNKILSGYVDGRFGVGDPITREQACKIFYNYCNGTVSGNTATILAAYPDGNAVSDWAREYVAWAAENHVVGGNGTLNPAGNANRAEMAQIIMNMSNNSIL